MGTRTALVSAPGAIAVETRELSAPDGGEVVVRVVECGLCRSDLELSAAGVDAGRLVVRADHSPAG